MITIRPVQRADLEQLYKLAKKVAPGITTFPPNKEVLAEKIEASIQGFNTEPSNESSSAYLMVLENQEPALEKPIIMGTAAVYANIGKDIPFYTFQILKRKQHSYDIEAKVTSNTLNLVNEYTGDTEIGTLVLDPGYRGGGYGKLLAKCRYMLIAQFRERFSERVFAELRGWSDEEAKSPFWENVGKHFFNGMSYEKADYLSATTNNQFIADLMPAHPIYIELLSAEAQAVIGKPHTTGEPALKMLFNEGFRYENYVDIFDAGPTVHVQREDITTIKNSRNYTINRLQKGITNGVNCLICNTSLDSFRVCQASVIFEDSDAKTDSVTISEETAAGLFVSIGDELRIFHNRAPATI